MKACPQCKAITFDDMDICYGCLYPLKSVNAQDNGASQISETHAQSVIAPLSVFTSNDTSVSAHQEVSLEVPDVIELDGRATIELQTRVIDRDKHIRELQSADYTVRQAYFIVRVPGQDDREILIPESEGLVLTIGRSPENDIVIRDLSISRHHARLSFRAGAFYIEDLNATNFTFLDGVPLIEQRHFASGGVLRIGAAQMLHAERPWRQKNPDGVSAR